MSMKTKVSKIIACTTLAGAGLVGVTAAPASAGCGLSPEVHNLLSSSATVDWADSDVRTSTFVFGQRVAGPWARLGSTAVNVAADATVSKAVTGTFDCSTDRQYRIQVSQGGSTWWEYYPSASTWTRNIAPHIHID